MSSGAQQQVHPWGPNGGRPRAAFEDVPSSPHHHQHFSVNDNHEMEIIVNTNKDIVQSEGAPRKTTLDLHSDLPSMTNSGVDEIFDPNHGCYFRDNRRRIDFILAYKEHHDANSVHENVVHRARREFYLSNLENTGIDIETEKVKKDSKIIHFVKIHVPFELALKTADHLKMEMPLKLHDKPVYLTKFRVGYVLNRFFNCYYCTKTGKETAHKDDSVIYYPFDTEDECLFDIGDHEKFFSHSQRHEIAWDVLQGVHNHPDDDKMRGVEGLVEHKIFETAYPIHDSYTDSYFDKLAQKPDTTRQRLEDTWANWRSTFTLQPLHTIRRYFGERIGFYFAFMDFYTKQLGIPTVAGIIAFIIGMTLSWRDPELDAACNEHEAPGSYIMCPICKPPACEPWEMYKEGCDKYRWEFALDNEATLALSCFVIFWAIMFFKLWKRREASLASEWNVFHIKTQDAGMRPEFEERASTTRTNPVTLKTEPHIPHSYRTLWLLISIGATFLLLCITGLCLAGLVVSRIALYGAFRNAGGKLAHHNIEYSRWFVHFLIFVLVTLTEKIYFKIGTKLTNLECPRTHHEYMSSLLWKMFIFELVNEFIPLGYAAWIKGKTVPTPIQLSTWTEICDGGCMGELVELVFVLLFFRLLLGNAIEIGVPFLKNCIKRQKTKTALGRHSSFPQYLKDYYLNEVELDGVYEEYMEMLVQFMFVVCFIPAFPLAPLVCLINNIIEIRLDATKLLQTNRRPVPMRVPGIQIWNQFLDLIVKLGILVNAGLIAFTSDIVPRLYYEYNRLTVNQEGTTHSRSHSGFMNYTLSYVNVDDWHDHHVSKEFEKHLTEKCYYQGFREAEAPYDHKKDYWRIAAIRVIAFAVYAVVFFIIMWFVNLVIPDVPGRTRLKVQRQAYLVKHFLNTQRRKTDRSAANARRASDGEDTSTALRGKRQHKREVDFSDDQT